MACICGSQLYKTGHDSLIRGFDKWSFHLCKGDLLLFYFASFRTLHKNKTNGRSFYWKQEDCSGRAENGQRPICESLTAKKFKLRIKFFSFARYGSPGNISFESLCLWRGFEQHLMENLQSHHPTGFEQTQRRRLSHDQPHRQCPELGKECCKDLERSSRKPGKSTSMLTLTWLLDALSNRLTSGVTERLRTYTNLAFMYLNAHCSGSVKFGAWSS